MLHTTTIGGHISLFHLAYSDKFVIGSILWYVQLKGISMKRKFFLTIILFIAVVTNVSALIQVSSPTSEADTIIKILTWSVVTMGAALVSVLVYFFNGLKADVSEIKMLTMSMNTRLTAVETRCVFISKLEIASKSE